jgi:signal transduction histidine kinase
VTSAPTRTTRRTQPPKAGSASARQITAAELRATEREKVRLSIELHDGVGQHLTGIAFLAKALANSLRTHDALPEATDAEEIARLTNQAIANIRALARGLRPVGLEDNALTVALSQLARDVTRVYGVECLFGEDEPVMIASALVSHHLYRIAQEGVHNAVKHGNGDRITLDLVTRGETIVLTVVNKGNLRVPGSGSHRDSPGIGIASMRHRAQVIGARLTLENTRSDEVRLRVIINHEAAQTLREEGDRQ